MTDFEVTFPKPCGEVWEKMSPRGHHRHCATCHKTIYDLKALDFDEAATLLEGDDAHCFRAQVSSTGAIALRRTNAAPHRRLMASVGAGLSLAVAACHTIVGPPVSPRYELTGQVASDHWASQAVLISSDGREYKTRILKGEPFRLTNLQPGIYSLAINGMCGEMLRLEGIAIRDSDANVGSLTWEDDCIIVGVMSPVKRTLLG